MTQRIALITGANKGIGLETARQLGNRGFTVLLGSRSPERGAAAQSELRGAGIGAHAVALEVTDQASVETAARSIEERFGHLDVLVNNAGTPTVGNRSTPPSGTSIDDMRTVYETNVFGLIRVTNAMLPLLRRGTDPWIVNVSSEVGSLTSLSDPESPLSSMVTSAQYPSSKTAVNMITVQYAKELAPEGFKVNAANPGFTDTDFTQGRGIRAVEDGAVPSVHLATLPDDGPTGVLYGHLWIAEGDGDGGYGILPW